MIEGTLNDCRRAAELSIARHAAMEGYTPANVHEEFKNGVYKAVWDTPDGKMQCPYHAPESEAPPLHVSDELLQQHRDMRERVARLSAEIG